MAKWQTVLLKNIKEKLEKENAMITKADKGKTCVIIYTRDYAAKVHEFLNNNSFHTLKRNPTNKYQELIMETLKKCNLIIQKKQVK